MFLLSVSRENLEIKRQIEKNLPYEKFKIKKTNRFCWFFLGFASKRGISYYPFLGATRGANRPI